MKLNSSIHSLNRRLNLISPSKSIFLSFFALLLLGSMSTVWATTYTVTNTSDADGTTCPDVNGQCSLRQAINAANNHPNSSEPDKIIFNIPALNNNCRTVEDVKVCKINVIGLTGFKNTPTEDVFGLPIITEGVFIDGSVPENRPDVIGYPNITRPSIEISGEDVSGPSSGLLIFSSGSTVKGLIMHSFLTSTVNIVGGECIVIAFGAKQNVVKANYLATDASGRNPIPIDHQGVNIAGPDNIVGGKSFYDRNVSLAPGFRIVDVFTSRRLSAGLSPDNNLIQNNYAGINVAGEVIGMPNDGVAVGVRDLNLPLLPLPKNTIIKENKIFFPSDLAVSSVDTIGTQLIDNEIVGGGNLVTTVNFNRVSNGVATKNIIKDNNGMGIRIVGASTVSVLQNSIFDNALLGIDINSDGVTFNDPDGTDNDMGPNNRQNFPVLTSATPINASLITVSGTLVSMPNTTYRIEFFSNKRPDPTGYGEGEKYIGSIECTTDSLGHCDFTAEHLPASASRDFITSTATEMISDGLGGLKPGSTSEFSSAIQKAP